MLCHSPSSFSSFHHHLQRRLTFIFLIFLIPKPPFFLLLHMVSHLTKCYFFFKALPLQRKVLLCLSRVSAIVFGSKYIDMW